jgi:hypothetical protein
LDIFIRSYKKDFEWLEYCLRSIRNHNKDNARVVLVVPTCDYQEAKKFQHNIDVLIATLPQHEKGYICQQISKLNAHTYCGSEYILYVDSDCIFFEDFTIESFMREGKPLMLKTRYELVGDAICWKAPTEALTGLELSYEYMRRLPLLHLKSTLEGLHNQYPNLLHSVATINHVSEFNIIGAYIDAFESEKYHILDTDIEVPPTVARQYWSWGGLTEEIKKEVENEL